MMQIRPHLLHLFLAIALVVAGLPAHAGSHTAASPIDADPGSLTQDLPIESDCPFHARTLAKSNPDLESPADDEPPENCCGPDCRCSCAGLTLMPVRSLTAPVVATPAAATARLATTRPSHLTTAPLRPPQV